jgi:hypothetical protein
MTKMTPLRWETPPASLRNRTRRNWQEVADSLKANPGNWAVVAEDVSASTGTHIRHGRLTAFAPEGAFEARVSGARDSKTGRAEKVYARFIGEKGEFSSVGADEA